MNEYQRNEPQLREPQLRAVLWFLGIVVLSTLCVGGLLLIKQINQRKVASPTSVPLPVIILIPSPTVLQVVVVPTALIPTAVPTSIPTVVIKAVAPTNIGISCRYGPPFINPVATPVPDGGHSQYEDYLCVNGYWFIGIQDWVDSRTGDWGTDGIDERGYVMYNADGSVADRKFINLQGNAIPGPTK